MIKYILEFPFQLLNNYRDLKLWERNHKANAFSSVSFLLIINIWPFTYILARKWKLNNNFMARNSYPMIQYMFSKKMGIVKFGKLNIRQS